MKRIVALLPAYIFASALFGVSAMADEHQVVATDDFTWESATSDALKHGDIIEVQVNTVLPHGFVTVKKDASGLTVEAREMVQACNEDQAAKPQAVLKELDCSESSKFGVAYKGTLRLEVLPVFKDDIAYWCTVHKGGMAGTLKLKP